jgi:hypothetical protein
LSPSHGVVVELQEELLTWQRELDSREGAVVAWEEGLVAFAHALGEVRAEHDDCHARPDAVQRDFFSQACASSSRPKQLMNAS